MVILFHKDDYNEYYSVDLSPDECFEIVKKLLDYLVSNYSEICDHKTYIEDAVYILLLNEYGAVSFTNKTNLEDTYLLPKLFDIINKSDRVDYIEKVNDFYDMEIKI